MGIGVAAVHTPGVCLPPPEEIPEEVLRTEIILEARSPLTGEPMSASEYAALRAELRNNNDANLVSPELRQLIFFLQLRRGLKPFVPFIP